jgi:CSLREA domain-containing protein
MSKIVRLLAFFAVLATCLGVSADAATLVVTNTNNNLAGSLRQAIQDAAPGDTILFQIPVTDSGYDSLTGVHTVGLIGAEIVLNKNLTIDGAGGRIVVGRAAGAAAFRIFNVASGNVTIANLTIRGGDSHTSTPAGGSGVYNSANLVLRSCTFVSNGVGSESGGAIYNAGTLDMTNCTLNDNNAVRGAGVYNEGAITVRNSSIAGNRGGDTTNSAGFYQAAGTARVRSTIIAENSGRPGGEGPDVFGMFISEGYNFIGNGEGSAGFGLSESRDQVGTTAAPAHPGLSPLADNGGPTPTLQLRPGSPAIDQGISGGVGTDQRGLTRPFDNPAIANAGGGDGSDIGAYETGVPQTGPTFTVTTVADRRDSATATPCTTDDCTLREALEMANANADANTINFAFSVRGIIPSPTDGFEITNPVTINGPGARNLALNGGGVRRVFLVSAPSVVISGLAIEQGFAPAPVRSGGAIINGGQLTLNECTIQNSVALNGAGIFNDGFGTLTLFGCTLRGNNNPDEGEGGAINNHGRVSVINCTFSGNQSFRGGAINHSGISLTMVGSTFTNNTARLFGGALEVASGAVAANTIFAGNTGPSSPEIRGAVTSEGHNFVGKSDGSTGFTHGVNGDIVGTIASPRDPLLGPLQNNGGPTDTHALLGGSPAINAADDSRALRVDQRGFSRVGVADIGAFEVGGLPTGLANIATRGSVGTDDNVLIGGFIITGTQPKRVLVRATGPSLGIPGQLANPQLELFNGAGERIAVNDDWQDAPNRQAIIDTTIPPTNDRESAVLVDLNPGPYTAIVSGVSRGTGIGLVEVYDLNRAADSRLANIATRGLVRTGDDVLIGGFIVVGGRDQRTLIRALGSSLPVAGKLSDPALEIYNGSGTLLVANDNWRSTQEAEIIASGIPPTNDSEAAIIGGVPAGSYTAIVRGAGAATGIALVEVYALQ